MDARQGLVVRLERLPGRGLGQLGHGFSPLTPPPRDDDNVIPWVTRSGLILTLGSQASGESAHQINMPVVRFTQRMGTIRCDRTSRSRMTQRGR
jgi:hypothetical protein